MKICPECGFQNPKDLNICLRCAASLEQLCPSCGAVVTGNNKFCGQCGARLDESVRTSAQPQPKDTSRPNIQEQLLRNLRDSMPASLTQKINQFYSQQLNGQRREVTILCVEIANYEQATRQIDNETLYLAIDHLMHWMSQVVYQYEGTIDQFSGQGLTALFGIPINHENDPERSVRSAFNILHQFNREREEISERYKFEFQIRLGINTGSVILGQMGSEHHLEYTVIGDTVNLVHNLMNSALPGQILVSFSTYQRTAHIFEFKSQTIKPSPVATSLLVYQPLSQKYTPGQVRGIPGLHVPMVGRLENITLMQNEKESALANSQSRIILISGEAGLGKTRLVAEFGNTQKQDEVNIIWGTCAAYMRITPYRIIANVIRNIIGVSEMDPIQSQREALQLHLIQLGLDQSDIMPNLLHVLGLLHSDPIVEARLRLFEPHMLQRETQLALRTYFSAYAQDQFTIFIFDDLHWVDQASQQFLDYYCQVLGNNPLMLILVSRDFINHEPSRLIAEAANKHSPPPIHIQLEPLSVQDSRILIDQFIPEKTDQATLIKNSIINRSAGIPFYTEELVRILMDLGGLNFDGDRWCVTTKANQLLNEVPGTLQDIILARFDRLPSHLRLTAQRASVLGSSFAVRLIESTISGSPEKLHADLAELEARDFLIHARFGNEDGYLFKHPLIQETIYKTLLRRDIRDLHFEIAQVIETGDHWLPAERNQVLAWHYSESHSPMRAIPFLFASAEDASQHFANDTVIQLYRQVLGLMEKDPGTYAEKIRQAKIHLGEALKFTGQFEEAAQIFQALIDEETDLAEKTAQENQPASPILVDSLRELADLRAREGDLDKAITLLKQGMQILGEGVQIGNPVAWRRMVDRLAWVYFRQGKLEEAHNWADLALMDLKSGETDDPITLASLSNTLGGIYWSRSRLQEAITSVERSLAIYRDLGYQWGVSIALTNLGVLNFSIGKWQTCVEYLERADQIRSDFGNHPERPINLVNLGEVFIAMGDYERAREKLLASLEISQHLGLHLYNAYTEMKLAFLAILEENSPEAHQHIENARSLLPSLDEISERTVQFYEYNARLHMLDGELSAALADAERAFQIANQGGFQEKKIDVLIALGKIQVLSGNYELAEDYLEQSINLKGGQYSEALGLLELGHLYLLRAQSNPQDAWAWYQQADNILDRVIVDFASLGAHRHLQHAQTLHAQLPTDPTYYQQPNRAILPEDEAQSITSLPESAGMPDGEWYQATILTIEMVPNQNVDEELLFETIAFLVPILQERIQENGGKVIRLQNNITGIFGVPTAHEDDPVRAVETAMQIVNFHTDLYQQTRLPVSIRLGITMGRIIAGGSNQNTEFIASGQPLLFSRTLAKLASPSHVWVTQEVYNATTFRFQYNHIAVNMVSQLDNKTIFQLEGEQEQILPVRGLIGLKTNFVGRQSEINTLVDASFKLKDNIGRIVWLEGDPGVGKSRLTRELETIVSPRGILVLRGTCTARRSDIAFSIFSELIAAAFGIQPNYSAEQTHAQIERHISERNLDNELRPFIELLLGVQPSGVLGSQLMALEPEQLRRQIFVSLNRFISWLVSKQPVILILDDIQWIDSISVDLLMYLSPLIFTLGVMFICIQRQNEASPYEQSLNRIRSLTAQQLLHLPLKPLSNQEVYTLLNQILGEAELEESVKSLIVQQSGGNPYYIEEFLRMLVEQDYLRLVNNKLEVNQSFEIDDLHIPSSLDTLIRARIDALPASSRQLLQVASVIGHQFSENLLVKISEQHDIGVKLANLQNRGMLQFLTESEVWEFGHPMIEIIVYNSVLKVQRRILHNRTAQALEEIWQGQEGEHADELAYHYGKADNHTKTLDYLILAGERAASRYANDAAMAYFEQAYDLLSAVPKMDDLQRYRIIAGLGLVYQFTGKFDVSVATLETGLDMLKDTLLTPDKYASLYRILAESFFQKGDLDQAIIHLKKALTFISEPGNPAAETEAARINNRLGWCYFRKADLDNANAAVSKAVEFAAHTKNLAAQAAAENLLGGINYSVGDTAEAMGHTRQAMHYFQELGYTWGEAIALNNLAILEASSGNWNAAANFFQRTLNLRIEMGDVEGIALAHNNLAELALDQGKIFDAEASFNASLSVSEPLKINFHQAKSYLGLVKTSLAQKNLKETAKLLKVAYRQATEVDAREILTELMNLEAELFLVNGELDQAEKLSQAAVQAALEINNSGHESCARRVWGETKLRQGQPAQGVAILDEALDRLSKNIGELETGRIHAQYARLYQVLDDPQKAEQHRAAAEKTFTSLGAELDLQKLDDKLPPLRV